MQHISKHQSRSEKLIQEVIRLCLCNSKQNRHILDHQHLLAQLKESRLSYDQSTTIQFHYPKNVMNNTSGFAGDDLLVLNASLLQL